MRNNNDKWLDRISMYTVSKILIIIALIILVTPWIFTLPFFNQRFNFSETGNIGDTIGGITGPFLNGLAALLVFVAFKAQINANKIFKNQAESQFINNFLNRIEDDNFKITEILSEIDKKTTSILSKDAYLKEHYQNLLNKTLYITTGFSIGLEMLEMVDKFNGDKKLMWKRIVYLYSILYKDSLTKISNHLNSIILLGKTGLNSYEADIIFQIDKLNKELKDIDKY